jgi:hypothetical protein
MAKKPNDDEKFEVTELDDGSLEDVTGGAEEVINNQCTVNSGNCVAGCACRPILV